MMKLAITTLAILATALSANAREHVKLDMGTTFTGIKTSAPVDIYLCNKADSAGFVVYNIETDVMNNLKINVSDKTLTISTINTGNTSMKNFYKQVSTIKVYMPQPLEMIELAGAGDIDAAPGIRVAENASIKISGAGDIDFEDITATTLSLSVTGAGDIELDNLTTTDTDIKVSGAGDVKIKRLNAASTDVSVTGSGDVKLDGTSKASYYSLSGAGEISCCRLISDMVTAKVSGSGKISCHASEMVTATCSGAGDIDIYGEPATAKLSGKKDNINIIK